MTGLATFTCPRCNQSTQALAHSVVAHRCPMVRGNAMTEWRREDERKEK